MGIPRSVLQCLTNTLTNASIIYDAPIVYINLYLTNSLGSPRKGLSVSSKSRLKLGGIVLILAYSCYWDNYFSIKYCRTSEATINCWKTTCRPAHTFYVHSGKSTCPFSIHGARGSPIIKKCLCPVIKETQTHWFRSNRSARKNMQQEVSVLLSRHSHEESEDLFLHSKDLCSQLIPNTLLVIKRVVDNTS